MVTAVFCTEYVCTSFMKIDPGFSMLITKVTSEFSETFSCWVSMITCISLYTNLLQYVLECGTRSRRVNVNETLSSEIFDGGVWGEQ